MELLSRFPIALLAASIGLAAVGCHHSESTTVARAPNAATPAISSYLFGQAAPPFATPPVLPGTPDIAALVDKIKGSVVNITTASRAPAPGRRIDPFEFFFRGPGSGGEMLPGLPPQGRRNMLQRRSLGSGFVIDSAGFVVTNDHVVDGADDIKVKLVDGREYQAKVAGRDPKVDVALLRLEGAADLPAVVLGDSDKLRVGEYVVAAGNPFGLGQTVTMGIVSAKDRTIGAGPYDDFIQTDASINPGNSGGPLFNLRGEVVGMNTAIHAQGQGIGFAIPASLMKDAIPQLRATGHVSRGKLGLVFQPVTEELARALGMSTAAGALVNDVENGGPADKAGIKSGDVITKVNGEPVREGTQLPRLVARNAPGSTLAVSYVRGGKEATVNVTLAPLQGDSDDNDKGSSSTGASPAPTNYGLSLQPTKDGVRVTNVSGSIQNLNPGDIVLEVDGKAVAAPQQVIDGLTAASRAKRPALVKIKRESRVMFTTVDVTR